MGWEPVDAWLGRVEEDRAARLGPAAKRIGEARVLEALERADGQGHPSTPFAANSARAAPRPRQEGITDFPPSTAGRD